ncbi:MAG TPA: biopolymer transporter ExbD [Pirellulaceae bacterium]|nr:biopolymer transporter ExbD [Pirellulaceae bacterium]
MRLSKHHRDHTLGFRMTPLIDVVFLLIIFFMTISQISRTNAHLIQVPKVSPAWSETQPVVLSLTVDQHGQLAQSGTPLSMEGFEIMIQQHLVRAEHDPSRLQVLIRYDHRCPSRLLNEIVRRLTARGIAHVRLAVTAE